MKGVIINKFRGDASLFEEGRSLLKELTGIPVVGVIPWFRDIKIEEEDSVALDMKNNTYKDGKINVAIILLKRMSNFTDFDVLEMDPRFNPYYTNNIDEIEKADIILLPGSKNTLSDLQSLRANGIAMAIIRAHKAGKKVIGICGGYQMMGVRLEDPESIEGNIPAIPGLGLLPQCTVIEQEKMDAMQAAAGAEPILNVLPMQAKKVGIITTGSEVFKGRIEDKFTPILQSKLAVYGCEMVFHKVCDDDPAGITAAILEAKAAGCELIFTTGGMSVDPDDRTPLAIKNTGADIITYGAPVLPGAMFLVSYLDGVPVCGLPGCVMYAKRTIFDLLLPRLLADDPITAEDIARLGEGGLCLNCEVCHWPNCGFGHC